MSLWKLLTGRYGSNDSDVDDIRIDASTNSIQIVDYEHHEIHSGSHYNLTGETELANSAVLDFCVTTEDNGRWPHLVFDFVSAGELEFVLYELTDFDNDGAEQVQFANNRAKAYSGVHDGGDGGAALSDAGSSFPVDGLIGWRIHNITDGSFADITDNDGTTVTGTLAGGTDNDWDDGDQYEINKSLARISIGNTVNSVGIQIGAGHGGMGTRPARALLGQGGRSHELVLRPNTNYLFRFTSGMASNHFAYSAEWYEHTDKH